MARPRKDNVDYFSHDTGMRNHRKLKALRNRFGSSGYGIRNMLLEHIGSCDHLEAKWNDIEQDMIAGDFGVPVSEIQEVVDFCVKLDLLQLEDEILKSLSLIERLQPLLQKRQRARGGVPATETQVPVSENPHSKVKNSKEEESITYIETLSSFSDFVLSQKQVTDKEKDEIEKCRLRYQKENKQITNPLATFDLRIKRGKEFENKKKTSDSSRRKEFGIDVSEYVATLKEDELSKVKKRIKDNLNKGGKKSKRNIERINDFLSAKS